MTIHWAGTGLLFLAAAAWGQVKPEARPAPPKAAVASNAAGGASTGAAVAPDAAVITISGLCSQPATAKEKAANCKTVVTRAEFEQLVAAVAPSIAPPAKKQLATQYGMALVMVHRAHELGLDRGPRFEELMRVARIGVLTKELNQKMQDEASQVSEPQIEAYYRNNEPGFQEVDLQRVFVPRSKQSGDSKEKAADDEAKKKQQESEEAMKKLAASLRERAAAGEDFQKLQDEAVAASELKGNPPTKLGKVRRTSLPPDQGALFDLKPGETSPLITAPNGYLIYKVGEKDTLPLDKVRDEISATLRAQRMEEAKQEIQRSASPELNAKYFGETAAASPKANAPGDKARPAQVPDSGPK